ncbi:MAG: type IV pilus assembly protein PilM [Syntrophobacteria bacterium]
MPGFLRKLKRPSRGHLGIDIGDRSMRVVEVLSTARESELVHCALAPMGLGSGEASSCAAELRGLLQQHGITNRRAVVAVGGQEVAVRRLRLPHIPEEDIPGAIRWQAREAFPFPLEDAGVAFQILSGGGDDSEANVEVLAAAATRQTIVEKTAVLREAGLQCVGVLSEPHSLAQVLLGAHGEGAERGSQAVIDLGACKTGIHIFQDGILQFSRDMAIGGDTITEALTGVYRVGDRQVTVDAARAEAMKYQYGVTAVDDKTTTEEGIPLSQLGVRMRPVLEKLETGISRSLEYYAHHYHGAPPSRLLLMGGGSQLKGIGTFFTEWFDLEADFLDPLAGLVSAKSQVFMQRAASNSSTLAIAAGLALPLTPSYNLLPPELQTRRRRHYPAPMAYAALALLFLLPVGQYVWQGEKQIAAIRRAATASSQELDRYESLLAEYQRLQDRNRQLDARLAGLPQVDHRIVGLAAALRIVSNKIPDNLALTGMEVKNVQGQDLLQLRMRGLVFGAEREAFSLLTGFMAQLEKTFTFRQLELGNAEDREIPAPATLSFEILSYIH